MKTPDKIYLNKYMFRPGMMRPAQYPADSPEFEYIRKDALLEWAKEELSKASVSSGSIGRRNAFIDVIDKLNSI